MLIKLLGFFDIIAAILLFLTPFINISTPVLLLFAFIMVVKGVFFFVTGGFDFFNLVNFGDILAGVLFYLSIPFALPKILLAVVALFLLQKGIFSYF